MGRVNKIYFFDVLGKYEYWKEKCVKSVLGEFNSGVSICRNKGTQIWGPLFSRLSGRGVQYGGPSSGSGYSRRSPRLWINKRFLCFESIKVTAEVNSMIVNWSYLNDRLVAERFRPLCVVFPLSPPWPSAHFDKHWSITKQCRLWARV